LADPEISKKGVRCEFVKFVVIFGAKSGVKYHFIIRDEMGAGPCLL
jgi:hypothetical protein